MTHEVVVRTYQVFLYKSSSLLRIFRTEIASGSKSPESKSTFQTNSTKHSGESRDNRESSTMAPIITIQIPREEDTVSQPEFSPSCIHKAHSATNSVSKNSASAITCHMSDQDTLHGDIHEPGAFNSKSLFPTSFQGRSVRMA